MRSGVVKNILAVATTVAWLAFLYLDSLWNACLSRAVTDATKTYGEIYGPLSFFRPIAMYLALGLSLIGAAWLAIPAREKKV